LKASFCLENLLLFSYWLDANSIIKPYREAYGFSRVPKFWQFLEEQAKKQVIASSYIVLKEIEEGCADKEQPDELLVWSRTQQDVLFLPPTIPVQQSVNQIANYVGNNTQYAPWHIQEFLGGADPWIIAHAKVLGGIVVTFEKSAPNSKKVKIPDVAEKFEVKCIDLWSMLKELNAQF
jgi:hypothetical protein